MARGIKKPKTDEWPTDAGRAIEPPQGSATALPKPKLRKFTALIDSATDARFGQLLADVRGQVGAVATRTDGHGRTRAGYDPSRADLLRALLVVAENDPAVRVAVYEQVRSHYGATS